MRGLIRKDWNTDVNYNPPWCFYNGVEGRLQSKLSQGETSSSIAYLYPSEKAEKL